MEITDLNLSVRAFNAVCRAGFKTAEELFQAIGENQESVRLLVGRSNFDRIDEAFAELEDKGMLEFTTKLPPAPAEETTPEYLEAFNLNARIHYGKELAEQGISVMCIGIEQMHSGKQYKKLGYANFEEYCQKEFEFTRKQGIKYADVGKMLQEQNGNSSSHFETLGINKLHLLAKLDEPTRETVTETIDVESVTVMELKAQITALTAERDTAKASIESKDKQFKEAMDAKDRQLKAVKESGEHSLNECRDYLNDRIHELENRIREMENAPIDHDMTDADAAEEIKRLKRELEDEQLKTIMLEKAGEAKARRAADTVRHELTQIHETELQTLREGYEKQLAETGNEPDENALDEARFNSFRLVFEEIVDELENLLGTMHDDPRIGFINRLDNYWTDNLLYLKRRGEGAGA